MARSAHRSPIRYTWAQPVPVKRKRPWRRFLLLIAVLAGVALLAWSYAMQVYAPGLRAEARNLPQLVHQQLGQHDAPYAPIGDISPQLQHAIVAIEDRRFYLHPGIDPLGIVRALWIDLTAQHVDQGGSTLEEQLVKRMITHQDRTIRAKIHTMALAWAVDQEFSKTQVLELYLNAAYYGQGAYGAASAARVYFGTDVAHLSLPQAAFLAALPQAPSVYGDHPRSPAIVTRKNWVLRDMAELGYITPQQAAAAQQAPLTFAFPSP